LKRAKASAAVDGPDLAGDVAGGVGGQEVHDAGDLLRAPQAPQRDLTADAVEDLLGHRLEHLRLDEARRDGVDGEADLVAVELVGLLEGERGLPGQRRREAEEAGLRRGVVRLADVAGLPDDRGDVDNPPRTALDHVLQRGAGHEEGAREVDGQDLVPVLVGHLEDRLVGRDAGVVDEDVQAPVVIDDLLHGAPAVLGRADVALMDGDRDLVFGELGLEGLGAFAIAAVARGDGGALGGQAVTDGGADAARAAGDHGDAALELIADGLERL
jgi:hypothetical protein